MGHPHGTCPAPITMPWPQFIGKDVSAEGAERARLGYTAVEAELGLESKADTGTPGARLGHADLSVLVQAQLEPCCLWEPLITSSVLHCYVPRFIVQPWVPSPASQARTERIELLPPGLTKQGSES